MGWFTAPAKTEVFIDERIIAQIEDLSRELAEVSGRLDAAKNVLNLSGDYAADKKRLIDLQIELDRVKETHAREKRETEHYVGLERKRVEQELELGKREATLAVREENLQADKARFERDVEFIKEQTAEQRETMLQILRRLPDVNVMLSNQATAASDDE